MFYSVFVVFKTVLFFCHDGNGPGPTGNGLGLIFLERQRAGPELNGPGRKKTGPCRPLVSSTTAPVRIKCYFFVATLVTYLLTYCVCVVYIPVICIHSLGSHCSSLLTVTTVLHLRSVDIKVKVC